MAEKIKKIRNGNRNEAFGKGRESMKLTVWEISEIERHLEGLNQTKEAALMKTFVQHGSISTYDHVIRVVRFSFYLNRRFHLGAPESELVRGAFLHDFFLYDWHKKGCCGGRLHGFAHPAIALKNAMRRYRLTPVECNIIESHMWPLTLFSIPKSRAAFIVCFADKVCSSYETLAQRKRCG